MMSINTGRSGRIIWDVCEAANRRQPPDEDTGIESESISAHNRINATRRQRRKKQSMYPGFIENDAATMGKQERTVRYQQQSDQTACLNERDFGLTVSCDRAMMSDDASLASYLIASIEKDTPALCQGGYRGVGRNNLADGFLSDLTEKTLLAGVTPLCLRVEVDPTARGARELARH